MPFCFFFCTSQFMIFNASTLRIVIILIFLNKMGMLIVKLKGRLFVVLCVVLYIFWISCNVASISSANNLFFSFSANRSSGKHFVNKHTRTQQINKLKINYEIKKNQAKREASFYYFNYSIIRIKICTFQSVDLLL